MMLENIAVQFWPVSSAKGEPWVNRVLRKIQTPDLDTEFAIQASAIKKPNKTSPKTFFPPLKGLRCSKTSITKRHHSVPNFSIVQGVEEMVWCMDSWEKNKKP